MRYLQKIKKYKLPQQNTDANDVNNPKSANKKAFRVKATGACNRIKSDQRFLFTFFGDEKK